MKMSKFNDHLHEEIKRLKEENERYRKTLQDIKRHYSDTITNDRRIRHIIGEIVDKALETSEASN